MVRHWFSQHKTSFLRESVRERGSSVGSVPVDYPVNLLDLWRSVPILFGLLCVASRLMSSQHPVVEVGGSSLELLHGGLTYSWKLLGIAACIYLPIANVITP